MFKKAYILNKLLVFFLVSFFYLNSFAVQNNLENHSPPTTLYHLKNGLTVLVRENHRAPVVVSQVWYRVGSVNELPGLTGISHALEHMMFEGSEHYPGEGFTRTITGLGGTFNAETDADFTYYYEEAAANQLSQLFSLEADRMAHLNITTQAFTKEIEVVKEERRMRTENNPTMQTYERFQEVALPGNPYQHPIVGWMRDLNQMTAADIQHWHNTWYAPNNATLVVVGDVDPKQVLALAIKYFGAIPAKVLPKSSTFEDIPAMSERSVLLKLPAKLPWLVMGYNVPSLKTATDSKDAYALAIMTAILSQGNSSRFMTDLIHGQNIASNAQASYDLFSRYSTLFILYGTPSQGHSLQQLQASFLTELARLQTTKVSAEEIARVKIAIEADHVYSQDSLSSQASALGSLISIGLPWQLADQFIEKIDKISPTDLQTVAKKYFSPQRLTVGMLMPLPMTEKTTPESMPFANTGGVH